jgi:hypothetical protein
MVNDPNRSPAPKITRTKTEIEAAVLANARAVADRLITDTQFHEITTELREEDLRRVYAETHALPYPAPWWPARVGAIWTVTDAVGTVLCRLEPMHNDAGEKLATAIAGLSGVLNPDRPSESGPAVELALPELSEGNGSPA